MADWLTVRMVIGRLASVMVTLISSRKATSLPGLKLPLSRGLQLAAPSSPIKPQLFSTLKLPDFLRKEQSVRWAEFKERMLFHTLQYLNLREFSEKWGPILNLKEFNKYVLHVYFHMKEL